MPDPELSSPLSDFLQTAHNAADVARDIARKWFRNNFSISTKADNSPVTLADKEIEGAIKEMVSKNYPEHHFFGEESGYKKESIHSDWTWVVDPIDGTKSFATGMPSFGILIALCQHDQPVLGIIDQPILQERWLGVTGMPTTCNGDICQTSDVDSIAQASLYSTTPDMFDASCIAQYKALSEKCRFRVFGGDCYSYGLLALGHTDIVCEAAMKPYDFLSLVPVIEGAGGIITDWQGKPLTLQSSGQVLACANQALHQQAIQILNC